VFAIGLNDRDHFGESGLTDPATPVDVHFDQVDELRVTDDVTDPDRPLRPEA